MPATASGFLVKLNYSFELFSTSEWVEDVTSVLHEIGAEQIGVFTLLLFHCVEGGIEVHDLGIAADANDHCEAAFPYSALGFWIICPDACATVGAAIHHDWGGGVVTVGGQVLDITPVVFTPFEGCLVVAGAVADVAIWVLLLAMPWAAFDEEEFFVIDQALHEQLAVAGVGIVDFLFIRISGWECLIMALGVGEEGLVNLIGALHGALGLHFEHDFAVEWEGSNRQKGDNGDHHEEFDQGKTLVFSR